MSSKCPIKLETAIVGNGIWNSYSGYKRGKRRMFGRVWVNQGPLRKCTEMLKLSLGKGTKNTFFSINSNLSITLST